LLGLTVSALGCARRASEETPEPPPALAKTRLPVGFLAHGAPTLALDAARGEPLRRWGRALPKPNAILCISAHFESSPISVEVGARPNLIYDFSGFPDALYRVQYPAPGAPALAERVVSLLSSSEAVSRVERGFDHGVWVPLVHLFPEADVPVVQVSLPAPGKPNQVVAMGRRLAPLRDEGILILGSGNLTHNLRRVDFSERSLPPAWASEFDAWVADALERSAIDELADFRTRAPAHRLAHPSDEHFTPVLAVAAAAAGETVTYPVSGFEYGSLSRRSPQIG
jgi:4,5-DOPA dioxygenase extradiol